MCSCRQGQFSKDEVDKFSFEVHGDLCAARVLLSRPPCQSQGARSQMQQTKRPGFWIEDFHVVGNTSQVLVGDLARVIHVDVRLRGITDGEHLGAGNQWIRLDYGMGLTDAQPLGGMMCCHSSTQFCLQRIQALYSQLKHFRTFAEREAQQRRAMFIMGVFAEHREWNGSHARSLGQETGGIYRVR